MLGFFLSVFRLVRFLMSGNRAIAVENARMVKKLEVPYVSRIVRLKSACPKRTQLEKLTMLRPLLLPSSPSREPDFLVENVITEGPDCRVL
jgi:hypothetical protein